MATMVTLHCTQKLLDRLGPQLDAQVGIQTDLQSETPTRLGNWHATVLFW